MSLFGGGTIKGNRITDFAQTTATVGIVIPYGYGVFPVDGNVIFADLPPKESVTTKKQGKGGVKQETYNYSLSYAIAFCKGPIYGFLWIKRNGKVVYTTDPNAPIDDVAYSQKWLQKATLYYGTLDQLPDSTIEAVKGSGKVSGFRGLAYIVVENDDVTEGGGAVPTYEAAVIASPPEVYVTSKPYPVHVVDSLNVGSSKGSSSLRTTLERESYTDFLTVGNTFISAELQTPLVTFNAPIDNWTVGSSFVTAELKSALHQMNAPVDNMTVGSSFVSAELKRTLISYTIPEPDQLQVSCQFIQGTLSS